jgi:hypothetical protein
MIFVLIMIIFLLIFVVINLKIMKTLINSFRIGLILLAIVSLSSCEKKNIDSNGIGTAEFAISLPDNLSQAKSGTTDDSAKVSSQIMISVEDMEGHAVFTDKLIPFYSFGTGFVSENVELKAGEFKLTKFMVINASGVVIYAAPVTGSPLAYLTTRPLPFSFTILPNQVTKILPEVLAVGDQTPDKFGYANFGIQIIKPLEFWTVCIIDNPLIMAPTPVRTTAKLTVYTPSGWHYTFKLEAAVNHLVIRGGSEIYYFILEKEGYSTQKLQFYAKDLLATTQVNPLILKIPWDTQYKVMVIQPGPEKGKDAMISNLNPEKNFGEHKYFEATYLSEPLLTVMRSNRSLIFFNLDTLPKSAIIKKVTMQLSYDLPIPFDNTYLTDVYPSTGAIWYGGVLQQIVEPWEEYKVTWNTQPKSVEANQVYIPPFIRNVNFIEIDVTRLFVPVAVTASATVLPNYGMMFKLWPTDKFPGFRFASSDYAEPKMRPRLTVYYTL